VARGLRLLGKKQGVRDLYPEALIRFFGRPQGCSVVSNPDDAAAEVERLIAHEDELKRERQMRPLSFHPRYFLSRPCTSSQSPNRSIQWSEGNLCFFMPNPCPPLEYRCSSAGFFAASHLL
jgi:hypothetical protein